MACPVEIEFAVDMRSEPMEFCVLQIRPIIADESYQGVVIDAEHQEDAICYSPKTMGNGTILGLHDLIYVRPDSFDPAHTRRIAEQISVMNANLRKEGRRYILIGPGRWGSADPWLGIPVTWEQVSAAQVIIETSLEGFTITPSQGTHFFQNLTSFRIGYLTVNPTTGGGSVDWDWLAAQKPVETTDFLTRLHVADPIEIRLDGRSRQGVVFKPAPSVD